LSGKKEELVSEPECYSLVEFVLTHKECFDEVFKLITDKFKFAKENEDSKDETNLKHKN